jgi:hypothetical protein
LENFCKLILGDAIRAGTADSEAIKICQDQVWLRADADDESWDELGPD